MKNAEKRKLMEIELEKLDLELDEYLLNKQEKEDIKHLYRVWKSCIDNKILIENRNKVNIRINDLIYIDGQSLDYEIDRKSTLHFINCHNITIIINHKVNHVTLEKCNNIIIKTAGGSVSGIDTINCKHIHHIFEQNQVYFLDISKSEDCVISIAEHIALNTTILSAYSFNLNINTTCSSTRIILSKFRTNLSYFDTHKIYSFEKNNDNMTMLYFSPNTKQCGYINRLQ